MDALEGEKQGVSVGLAALYKAVVTEAEVWVEGLVYMSSKFQVFSLSLSITSIFSRLYGVLNVSKKNN